MKILQVNCIYKNYSTGRTTMELAEELERRGFQSYVAYSSGECDCKNKYHIGNKIDRKIHALFSRIFGLQGYFSFFPTKKFINYVKKIKPDIIHLRNLHSNYININILLNFLAKENIATVVTLHDCFFYTGKCTHYTNSNCYKWKEHCGSCPRLKNDNKSFFVDRTSKILSDRKKYFSMIEKLAVIGVSKWITDEAKQSVLKNAKIIDYVYNWVDFKVFKPTESDKRKAMCLENKFVILSVAALFNTSKGIYDIIELSNMLTDEYRILLIGIVDVNLKNNKKIIEVGQVSDVNQLAEYYSLSDCTISCSSEESFGKTIAESLSCGTPAIVYNSTALSELIGGNCGYVVEKNNIVAVLEKIHEIKSKSKKFFSDSCIKYAHENFDIEKNIEKYIDIYSKLLN